MSSAIFAKHPIFSSLTDDARKDLARHATDKTFPADAVILKERQAASDVFFLLDGAVRVFYERPDGAEMTAKVLGAPAMFGEAEALSGRAYLETVRALSPARVLVVPIAAFRTLIDQPRVASAIIHDLAARLTANIYSEKSLAFDPVTVRLANYVVDHLRWISPTGHAMQQLHLTQEELARAIGVSRRSITKDLSAWMEAGILRKTTRGYVVDKWDELERYADPARVGVHHSIAR